MRSLLFLPLILLASAPAAAELTDLRARISAHEGQIYIGFDSQPRDVTVDAGPGGAVVRISGVAVRERRISPAHDDLLRSVLLSRHEDGVRLDLDAARLWSGVEARVYANSVVLTVQLGGGAAPETLPHPADPAGEVMASPAMPNPAHNPAHSPAPAAPARDDTVSDPVPGAEPSLDPAPSAAPVAAPEPAPTRAAILSDCAAAEAAVAADPWDDAALIRHAICLAEAGELASAAGIYEQMLAFEPENAAVAYALAEVREQQGDHAAAAQHFRQAASHARSDAAAAAAINRARALEGQ